MNIISKEIEEKITKAKSEFGDYLYHYTSVDTLIKILKSQTFLLGNTSNMNDASELMDFVDRILLTVFDEENIDSISSNEKVCELKNKIQQQYPYIMCLSYARDDASLWERYANNAQGVCIAFNLENLYKLFLNNKFLITPIFYEYDQPQHKFVQILSDYYFTGQLTEGFESFDGVVDNLTLCAAFHKHISFISEKEVRLIPLGKLDFEKSIFIKCGECFKNMYEVKVAELCQKNNATFESLFNHILLGPRSEQSLFVLRKYVDSLGFKTLAKNIFKSDCPLR